MIRLLFALAAALFVSTAGFAQNKPTEGPYPVDPDSQPQEGVPKGTVTEHRFENSKSYPGTIRDYFVSHYTTKIER